MNRSANKHQNRQLVAYFAHILVAAVVMMWGTMNLVANVMDLIRGQGGRNWPIASLFILMTAVVPLAIGFWMVRQKMKQANRSSPKSAE